jgi:hypothetical protein
MMDLLKDDRNSWIANSGPGNKHDLKLTGMTFANP